MRHVVPAMSVITPIGQSPEVYETTKKKPGCLSKPIMYSGTSSQTFALDCAHLFFIYVSGFNIFL